MPEMPHVKKRKIPRNHAGFQVRQMRRGVCKKEETGCDWDACGTEDVVLMSCPSVYDIQRSIAAQQIILLLCIKRTYTTDKIHEKLNKYRKEKGYPVVCRNYTNRVLKEMVEMKTINREKRLCHRNPPIRSWFYKLVK